MDSNDSENLLFSASEEHDSEMTTVENTVEMKFNMWLGIFSSLCCWFLALGCFVADEDDVGIILFYGMSNVAAIFWGAAGIIVLTRHFRRTMILSNEGITMRHNVDFLGLTIFNKSTLTPWRAISRVYYVNPLIYITTGFNFLYKEPRGKKRPLFGEWYIFHINYMCDNYKKGIEYAAKKVPKDKFTEAAKDKLIIMGIWQ